MKLLDNYTTVNNTNHLGSEKYTHINSRQIIDTLVKEFDYEVTDVLETRIRKNKEQRAGLQRHMVRLAHKDSTLTQVGDSRYELVMVNSHDATTSFKLMYGLFRLVCSNGMIVSDNTVASYKARHIDVSMEDIARNIARISAESQKVREIATAMTRKDLSSKQALEFSAEALKLRGFEDKFHPEAFLERRRNEDRNPSLWNTYNVLQENLIRGPKYRVFNKETNTSSRVRRVASVDNSTKINTGLWDLALNYLN